jgi:DEAD/DEAH box helicase domain-containing protein
VVAVHRVRGPGGELVDWPTPIDPRLATALARRGICQPYAHQAAAIAAIQGGRTHGAGDGDGVGQVAVLSGADRRGGAERPAGAGAVLFPTKALARDQVRGLRELVATDLAGLVGSGAYDGDTPPDERRAARARAHVVATNPDMLHRGILPHHDRWAEFLANLRLW